MNVSTSTFFYTRDNKNIIVQKWKIYVYASSKYERNIDINLLQIFRLATPKNKYRAVCLRQLFLPSAFIMSECNDAS